MLQNKTYQIQVYEVSTEIFHELIKFLEGVVAVKPPAKSQNLRYIYLKRWKHGFYCKSDLCYGGCKNNKTYQNLCMK